MEIKIDDHDNDSLIDLMAKLENEAKRGIQKPVVGAHKAVAASKQIRNIERNKATTTTTDDDDVGESSEKIDEEGYRKFRSRRNRNQRSNRMKVKIQELEEELKRREEKLVKRIDEAKEKHKRPRSQELNYCVAIEPEGFNNLEAADWELITMYVDSGATEIVLTQNMLSMLDLRESLQSKRGVEYEVANGIKIPNMGEKNFIGHTGEGHARNLTAQVCEVNKALLSVTKLVKAGNKVLFGDTDGIT